MTQNQIALRRAIEEERKNKENERLTTAKGLADIGSTLVKGGVSLLKGQSVI